MNMLAAVDMTAHFDVRTLSSDDASAVCALWRDVLPPTHHLGDWLDETVADLIEREAINGSGIFDSAQKGRCISFGLSCFLREEAVDAYMADPRPYMNLRLLEEARQGDFTNILLPSEVAPRNAGDGLDLFVLEWCQATYDFSDPFAHQLLNLIIPEYIRLHQSFKIRRSFHETEVALGHIQESGLNKRLFDVFPQDPWSMSDVGPGPRAVYGLTKEDALKLPGVGVAKTIFGYTEPRFGFRPREQKILKAALAGATDVDIAEQLGISRDGVRNHWNAIYARVADVDPHLLESPGAAARSSSKRGSEKRRRLLAKLAGQTQELRPYAKKTDA